MKPTKESYLYTGNRNPSNETKTQRSILGLQPVDHCQIAAKWQHKLAACMFHNNTLETKHRKRIHGSLQFTIVLPTLNFKVHSDNVQELTVCPSCEFVTPNIRFPG